MFVAIVYVRVKPEHVDAFAEATQENAPYTQVAVNPSCVK